MKHKTGFQPVLAGPQNTNNLKQRMKTTSRPPIALLLLGTFLLVWAGTATATDHIVDSVTVTVSSLSLIPGDTVTVINSGTLFVDANATFATLTIGDFSSAGNVVFNNVTVQTLTLTGDVAFGQNPANFLDMTVSTAHTLQVGGNFLFLASQAGNFRAGASTIEYNKTTVQNVTANIGGSGTTIQYKNLVLSGNPATGIATKNFANGVTVQGALTIKEKAVPFSGSVVYGALATLVYNGTVAQNTTPTEWPVAPSVLNVPVTINNGSGVTLDSDKTIGAALFPNSLILLAGTLYVNCMTLTVQGNIANATALQGTGVLVLGGSSPQTLSGPGHYGNVTLNNTANPFGASLPDAAWSPPEPIIKGMLTIANGKLNLPNGTTHKTSLLTFGGLDKAAGDYGSSSSAAIIANQSDTAFDSGANGILHNLALPVPLCSSVIEGNVVGNNCGALIPPLQNWTVRAFSGAVKNYFGITDANGHYAIIVPPGTYTVSSYLPPVGWIELLCGGPYSVIAIAGGVYPGNDFWEKATVIGRDLAVDLVSFFPYPLRSPCCGQNMTYVITYRNAGTVALTGVKVILTYPAVQTFVPATDISAPPLGLGVGLGTRTWTVPGALPAHASGNIMFTVTLPSPCTGPIVATARITFPAWLALDVQRLDNTRPLTQQITCSHDPNDMQVTPAGCGPQGFIPAGQPLTYLIRFQNTGTAPAYQVVVSNALNANLDVSTLKVIGSSHPNVLEVQGNQLVWTFPSIDLPAQSADDLGSQGYVKYQVSPLGSASAGTIITNQAAIYFDLNAPVNTVTTTNTITASPVPVASFSVTPAIGSAGHTNDYTYTGGNTGAQFLWDFGPDATPSTSTAQNPTGVIFASDGDKMVTLQVSLGGCQSDPAVQILTVGVPSLNAEVLGGQLLLSWQGNGYHLQERGDLQSGTPWTATSATVTQVDSDYSVTLPLDGNAKFYRLSQVAP
jgi:uncharacterized repeat protein (TIGR01451 family)